MAKTKNKQPLLGPLRKQDLEEDANIDNVMQDVDPRAQERNIERVSRASQQEKSMSNKQEPIPKQAPPVQPSDKDGEIRRQQLTTGVKDALSYFGPRLASLIIGGTEAMDITGGLLDEYQGFSNAQQDRRQQQEQLKKSKGRAPMTEYQAESLAMEDKKIAALGLERQNQQQAQLQKMEDLKKQQLEDINTKLSEFGKAQAGLAKGGVTGLFDKYGAAAARRMGLGDTSTTTTQQILREMRVDEALESVAKTKGAISDAEMKLFLEKAPQMTADESEWKVWLDRRREALESARKRIETGQMSDRPASQEDIMKLTSTEVELPDGSVRRIPNSQLKSILTGRGQ